MIIQNSQVAVAGTSSYQKMQLVQQQMAYEGPGVKISMSQEDAEHVRVDSASISIKGADQSKNQQVAPTIMREPAWKAEVTRSLLSAIMERLMDRKSYVQKAWASSFLDSLTSFENSLNDVFASAEGSTRPKESSPRGGGQWYGGNGQVANLPEDISPALRTMTVYQRQTVSIENSMSFQAKASVKTADGRSIDIDLMLNMSQSFYEEKEELLEVAFRDPLVINIGATSAQLSQTKFEFDLDCDGKPDQISRLLSGSGYLALDKNGDGVINDGSELFGTQSGNGFQDLAQYDQDGNGWIDEADDIFHQLRIWQHHEDGSTSLIGLGEAGVGAIYLGSANTDYLLGDLNSPDGMIRKTGFFLFEDGQAGTVQHVDLAV